ncbi:MAG TPA: site-specific integrase, partial [Chthoniobacterales bacterium]
AKALNRFEVYTRFKSFRAFRIEQAVAFKDYLARQVNARTNEPLSKATAYSTLAALKAFFQWLSREPRFKTRLAYSDADYFSLSLKDTAIAKASNEERIPTLDQIRHVIGAMPFGSYIEKRDRALIAFVLLTGARDNAVASMRLQHVDLAEGRIFQDARQVRTKFSKTFTTYFFPVGEDILAIVAEWVAFLQKERFWGLDDPLFPATRVAVGSSGHFEAAGFDRKCWANATPIRAIFRAAFVAANLPYFNPHSFRKTLARLGQEVCQTPEQFKAWSQNLGHESVMTTFSSYGQVNDRRQAEIIRLLGREKPDLESDEVLVQEIAKMVSRHQKGEGSQAKARS